MIQLSVVINTKNSQKYLDQTLRSVKGLADEIVIVDMKSTDKTLAIAAKHGANVYQYPHADIGFVEPAREFAFAKTKGDWILLLDSDEEIKNPLAKLISQVINGQTSLLPIAEAYFLPRSNIIFDHALTDTGWYPDYQLRLWRKGAIRWLPDIHSVPKIIGKTAHFPSDDPQLAIVHHNYQTIEQFIQRSNHYSSIQATEQEKKPGHNNINPASLYQSFFDEFFRRAFAQNGLEEGNHGLLLSFLQAQNELLVQAKIWQNQGFPYRPLTPKQIHKIQKSFFAQVHYWWANYLVGKTTGLTKLYWQLRRKLQI